MGDMNMFVCLFVGAGGRTNPLPPPKTDWCRAPQLTRRARSINQLPERGGEEMMFLKLAALEEGGAYFRNDDPPLIGHIQETRRNTFEEITLIL